MTEEQKKIEVQRLTNIFILSDSNPAAIDRYEKERLYALSQRFPSIHHMARRLANRYWQDRK